MRSAPGLKIASGATCNIHLVGRTKVVKVFKRDKPSSIWKEYNFAWWAYKLGLGVRPDYMVKLIVDECAHIGMIMPRAHCDLHRYVREPRELSEKNVFVYNILVQVCRTLYKLHFGEIYHRDLKPNNIFVYKGVVYIGDFGVSTRAKYFLTDFDRDRRPVCSTFPAPEQYNEGTWCRSASVDMWALGVTALYIMFEKYPFGVNDPHEVKRVVDNLETALSKTDFEIYTPMLRGLLNYNIRDRWTSEQALEFLENIKP